MGILCGLIAALMWGSGDVLVNRLTGLLGTSRSLVVTQLLSLVCWIGMAFWLGFPFHASLSLWGMAALAGVFHVVGLVLTYRAFEVGTLSIVSPIASSFAIVTALLSLIGGEKPGGLALTGAGLLVVGIVVVTRGTPDNGPVTLKGVPEALGSALGFGVMFWLIDGVAHDMGMAGPLIVLKVMATVSAVVAALHHKEPMPTKENVSRKEVAWLGLGVAVSDSLAWAAWIWGTKTSFNTIVTALASLFSVFTVILAAIFLKERLNKTQLIGVGVVLFGVLLVSLKPA